MKSYFVNSSDLLLAADCIDMISDSVVVRDDDDRDLKKKQAHAAAIFRRIADTVAQSDRRERPPSFRPFITIRVRSTTD